MNITVFGVLWLSLLMVALFLKDFRYMLFCLIVSMTLQCVNVVTFSDSGVGPQVFTCAFFIFKSYLGSQGVSASRTKLTFYASYLKLIIIIFFLVAVLSIVINKLFDINTVMKIIQLGLYVYVFNRMMKISTILTRDSIEKIILYVTYFTLVVGLIQFLTTTGVIPRLSIISELLYNEKKDNVYYYSDDYYRICSTFMEPSYYSVFLVGAFSYFSTKNFWNRHKLIFLPIVIELILTRSSTGYIAFLGCVLINLFFNIKNKINRSIIMIGLISIPFILIFGKDILDNVLFNKLNSGSAITRKWWNIGALNDFKSSTIIGVGYKNSRGSSIFYSVLGQLGLLGCIFYILFNLVVITVYIKNKDTNLDLSGFSFAVVGAFICQLIACPDLDLSPYWLFIFLLGGSFYLKSGDYNVK